MAKGSRLANAVVTDAVNEWCARNFPLLPAGVTDEEAARARLHASINSASQALVQGIVGHLEAEGLIGPMSKAAMTEPRDMAAPVDSDGVH